MMTTEERAQFDEVMWRAKNDRMTQSQFEPLSGAVGYLCDNAACGDRPAAFRRPPAPSVKARYHVLLCVDCWRRLPES